MREVKPEWVTALQRLTGNERDTIRWNALASRYEFILCGADGVPRSQFWCRFDQEPDPVTGLRPFRELNDDEMRVALSNLERTFVGNPYDGEGSVQRDIGRRYFFNKRLSEQRWKEAGEQFSDFMWEHRRQLRDAGAGPVVNVPKDITKRRIEVVSR